MPEYQSSPEIKEPQAKRPKVDKNWMKIQEFSNSTDAEECLNKECCWSKYTSKDTAFGQKVFYRCNKAKLRGKQCDSGVYLIYDSRTPKVMLYKSGNDHSCDKDGNNSARVLMTEETKQFIEKAFIDSVRGRKQIQAKLNAAKIPLPSRNQLNNFLAHLRNKHFGPTKISLSELEIFCVQHSAIPTDPDEPYVVDYFIDYHDEGNFRCFIATQNLLKNAVNREVISADSTYKMVWEGFPLSPIGTTDQDRHFHLYGTLLSKMEAGGDFEFAFRAIKLAVQKIHNFDMKPTVLISDAAGAIHNGAKAVFGIEIFIRMCWFHFKKALKKNLPSLISEIAVHNSILSDVDKLQLSQSPEIFNRASNLFLKKYNKYKSFCRYFSDVWLKDNPNWYEGCTPIPSPSTNNALESWNSLIKREKSFRNRYPMNQFLDLFLEWHLEWSQEYSSGAKAVIEVPTVTLDLFTKSYNWARLNKPLKSITDDNGCKYYDIAAGLELTLKDFNLLKNWTTFDQFKNRAFIGWKIVWEDNWRNSVCNCPVFMKNYICKHVVGIGIRKSLIEVPMEAKTVPIGKKRPRGRPPKARKALIVQ